MRKTIGSDEAFVRFLFHEYSPSFLSLFLSFSAVSKDTFLQRLYRCLLIAYTGILCPDNIREYRITMRMPIRCATRNQYACRLLNRNFGNKCDSETKTLNFQSRKVSVHLLADSFIAPTLPFGVSQFTYVLLQILTMQRQWGQKCAPGYRAIEHRLPLNIHRVARTKIGFKI